MAALRKLSSQLEEVPAERRERTPEDVLRDFRAYVAASMEDDDDQEASLLELMAALEADLPPEERTFPPR